VHVSNVVEIVTFEPKTETSSKIPRPRRKTSKFVHFAEIKKNVVITSKLIFFKFLASFRPVLIVSYLQIEQTKIIEI